MEDSLKISPGTQRLFHDMRRRYILLHKAGIAVSFWIDDEGEVHLSERLHDVDFKATGTLLKQNGWHCIGPGMEYAWLITPS